MGRAHEVRAASMAKTAAAKSKLNNKWSRIIYMAAKAGVPDPELNQNSTKGQEILGIQIMLAIKWKNKTNKKREN